ncbi:hypothetical protein [uncultured Streptococcus sp.]|uniref:hypothetical protein n=1 Tax=uncultured Streptococcus sp. TaxID=83427 RepID=UPI0027DCA3C3|nr:hypothetical protein [uncultured Streptococcus sp.]
MIYEEIRLDNWQLVVLMVILLAIGYEIAKIKPKDSYIEPIEEKTEKLPPQHRNPNYGAYIQAQGKYYN